MLIPVATLPLVRAALLFAPDKCRPPAIVSDWLAHLGGDPLTISDENELMTFALRSRPGVVIFDARTEDKILYLKADKTLDYSKVLDAIDIASKNGVRVVGMISDQKSGTTSTVAGDTKSAGLNPLKPGGK